MVSLTDLSCALSLLLFLFPGINNALSEEYKTYIIQMDHTHKPAAFLTHESWHRSTLRSLSNPVIDDQKFLYSYSHALHGFSAMLTPSQVAEIKKKKSCSSCYKRGVFWRAAHYLFPQISWIKPLFWLMAKCFLG